MEEFKNLQETKLTSQPIFDGDVLHIYKDTVRLPNGKTSTREYTVHHGAVCILPLLENGDVLLERQFRYAMGEVLTEIPAGKLDYIGEDPREAALRELREETGAVASELIPLGPFYPTCAYSTEVIQMFLARGLSFGERDLDEDEFLNVFRLPLRELVEKVLNGEIPDRLDLRAGGTWLQHGLRYYPAFELRTRRHHHGRRICRLLRHDELPSSPHRICYHRGHYQHAPRRCD